MSPVSRLLRHHPILSAAVLTGLVVIPLDIQAIRREIRTRGEAVARAEAAEEARRSEQAAAAERAATELVAAERAAAERIAAQKAAERVAAQKAAEQAAAALRAVGLQTRESGETAVDVGRRAVDDLAGFLTRLGQVVADTGTAAEQAHARRDAAWRGVIDRGAAVADGVARTSRRAPQWAVGSATALGGALRPTAATLSAASTEAYRRAAIRAELDRRADLFAVLTLQVIPLFYAQQTLPEPLLPAPGATTTSHWRAALKKLWGDKDYEETFAGAKSGLAGYGVTFSETDVEYKDGKLVWTVTAKTTAVADNLKATISPLVVEVMERSGPAWSARRKEVLDNFTVVLKPKPADGDNTPRPEMPCDIPACLPCIVPVCVPCGPPACGPVCVPCGPPARGPVCPPRHGGFLSRWCK